MVTRIAVAAAPPPPISHALSSGDCLDAAPLGELSKLLVTLDIELSLYFPLDSFVTPVGKACTLQLMQSLARCDAIFVPGGDGSTPLLPVDLFALTQQLADAVHAVHNGTKFYVSLQQYSARNMSDAWSILSQGQYKGVISGMVYGPHTVRCSTPAFARIRLTMAQDVSLEDFVAAAPTWLDVRVYPDVCHTIYSQYDHTAPPLCYSVVNTRACTSCLSGTPRSASHTTGKQSTRPP